MLINKPLLKNGACSKKHLSDGFDMSSSIVVYFKKFNQVSASD